MSLRCLFGFCICACALVAAPLFGGDDQRVTAYLVTETPGRGVERAFGHSALFFMRGSPGSQPEGILLESLGVQSGSGGRAIAPELMLQSFASGFDAPTRGSSLRQYLYGRFHWTDREWPRIKDEATVVFFDRLPLTDQENLSLLMRAQTAMGFGSTPITVEQGYVWGSNYRYDLLDSNCATRVRDAIGNQSLRAGSTTDTYRDSVEQVLDRWIQAHGNEAPKGFETAPIVAQFLSRMPDTSLWRDGSSIMGWVEAALTGNWLLKNTLGKSATTVLARLEQTPHQGWDAIFLPQELRTSLLATFLSPSNSPTELQSFAFVPSSVSAPVRQELRDILQANGSPALCLEVDVNEVPIFKKCADLF